ncbi:MAG: prolipoprotein diacylglyceryl transferase [Bacteroidota bacterium]|nr:prolipoprotein diacylglyceryl transferase [Bacteroidota bacterium]
MEILSYFVWDPNPEIFPNFIDNWKVSPRYYGLLFAFGFILSQQFLFYIFRKEGKPKRDVEVLTIYMVLTTLIGARIGHVIFYEPEVYLRNPIEILKIWRGGLASHGAALGILIGLFLYVNYYYDVRTMRQFPFLKSKFRKKQKEGQTFLWIVDRLVMVVALTGCFIRVGNFINSEIIGKPTDLPIGVVFARSAEESIASNPAIDHVEASKWKKKHDKSIYRPVLLTVNFKRENFPETGIRNYLESEVKHILSSYPAVTEHFQEPPNEPLNYILKKQDGVFQAQIKTYGIARHPAQLYEAFTSFLLFILLFVIWNKRKLNTLPGLLFGMFLVILFSLRFLYEFLKENQVGFEEKIPLNMGQWLSLPFIILGVYILLRFGKKVPKKEEKTQA